MKLHFKKQSFLWSGLQLSLKLQVSLKKLLLSIPYENNSEVDIVLLPK